VCFSSPEPVSQPPNLLPKYPDFLLAMLGFIGYPLLGVYKSIRSINATPAESKILLARQIQGSEIGRTMSKDGAKARMVLNEFESVIEKWEYL
jgi:hypothetical protein